MFQRIFRAQGDYARCIDDDRLEEWPFFFVERCLYKVTTAENHKAGLEGAVIFADSRAALIDRVTALREANIYERHSYRHILGAPSILSESDGETRSETAFLVVRIMRDGSTNLFECGRYLDTYVVDDKQVLLKERRVVCDSSRIDTLLAIPL